MLNHVVLFIFFVAFFQCFLSANCHSGVILPTQLHIVSSPSVNPNPDYQPVIGILSHPGDGASGRISNDMEASFIHASYVKLVEAAGGRVVPLIYNEPQEKLLKKLELVNGVLFTGGWVKDGPYFETVERVFKKALEKNDAGDHFPLYAICLGFQLITLIISQDNNILENFKAQNQATTLQFVKNAHIEGTVFQRFPPDLLKKLSTDSLVMQNHAYGISPAKFLGNQKLSSFFEILTTCKDEEDKVYVSTVRSKKYPVTGFQWHPEVIKKIMHNLLFQILCSNYGAVTDIDCFNNLRFIIMYNESSDFKSTAESDYYVTDHKELKKNAFVWGSTKIPHTQEAIQTTQYVANFLVSEASKSLNRPVAQELFDNLIYNHCPTFYAKEGKAYDEVYVFV